MTDSVSKRIVDLALAVVAIAVTAPLWIAIALAVCLTSRGPVIYSARRVGKNGRPFTIYKFRSMRSGADRCGPGITGAGDPRVTPVGRILRATKLDELPQLVNVLLGDMSLVGPRPEAPEYVATYDNRQRLVLFVRPGITGLTQLAYAREEQLLRVVDVEREYRERLLPHKIELDLTYIAQRTLWGDIRLLLATVARIVGLEALSKAEIRRNGVHA